MGVAKGVSLGVVQLLVFSCYAGSFWLGAFLVQQELIQAGEFVTVSLQFPGFTRQAVVALTTGFLCGVVGGCVHWPGSASPAEAGGRRDS